MSELLDEPKTAEPNMLIFEEFHNVEDIKGLLLIDLKSYQSRDDDDNEDIPKIPIKTALQGLLELANKGPIFKTYIQKNGLCRFYYENGSYGYLYLPREIRNYLASRFYYDTDIENCYPFILNYLFKKHNIKCPEMEEYIENRAGVLEREGFTKMNFLIMINTDKCYRNNAFKYAIHQAIHKELIPILKKERPEYFIASKKPNPNGSFITKILQEEEQKIVSVAIKYVNENSFKIGCLMYDGFYVVKDERFNISELNDYVSEHSDIKAKFALKEVPRNPEIESAIARKRENIAISSIEDECDSVKKFNDESKLAEALLEPHYDEVFNAGDVIFIRNCHKNWVYSEEGVKDTIRDWIRLSNFSLISGNKFKLIRSSCKSFWSSIITQVITLIKSLPIDTSIVSKMDCYKDLLLFNDKAYSFKTKKIIDIPDDIYYSHRLSIDVPNRPSQSVFDEMFSLVLNPIFNNDIPLMREYFKYCSRALAGHIEDKLWFSCQGERNSGKGVSEGLFKYSFESYIGEFNINNFIIKKNSMLEADREYGWMSVFIRHRLLFGSEVQEDAKLNGITIKKLSSGGDTITLRQSYGRTEFSQKIKGSMILQSNVLPDIEPKDCYSNLLQMTFPCEFRNESDNSISTAVIRPKNDRVKDWINERPENKHAFMYFVFDCYEDNSNYPILSNNAKKFRDDLEILDPKMSFLNQFEFTGLDGDFISNKDLKELDIHNLGFQKIKKLLLDKGLKEYRTNQERGVRGIKVKSNDNQVKLRF